MTLVSEDDDGFELQGAGHFSGGSRADGGHLSSRGILFRVMCGLMVASFFAAFHLTRATDVASQQPTDLLVFHDASRLMGNGGDPYAAVPHRYSYMYPPLFAWLFSPLSWLEYPVAVRVWALVSTVAWILVVMIGFRLQSPPESARRWWVLAVLIVLPYRWVLNHILHGQVDLLVTFVLVLSCWMAVRRRDLAAGFLVALAFLIKLLPVAFLGCYALRRRWRVVAAAGVAIPLLFVLPVSTCGPERFIELLHQWRRGPLLVEIADPASDAQESNQGLAAALYRYGTPKPLPPPEVEAPSLVKATVAQVTAVYVVAAVVILGWALPRVGRAPPGSWPDLVSFALFFVLIHLLSRRSWGYHYVTMVFTDAVLIGLWADSTLDPSIRRRSGATLLAAGFLQNFYSPMLVGKSLSGWLSSYGPTTLSFILLGGSLGKTLEALRAPTAPPDSWAPRPGAGPDESGPQMVTRGTGAPDLGGGPAGIGERSVQGP